MTWQHLNSLGVALQLRDRHGNRYEDYTKYDYTRYEKQDYVDSSAPA